MYMSIVDVCMCIYIYCEQAEFGDFNEWEKNDCLRIFYVSDHRE